MSTVLLSAEPQRTEKELQHIQMAKICTDDLCVLKEKKVVYAKYDGQHN